MKRFFGFTALVLTVFAFTFISCKVEADNSSPTVNTVAVTGISLDKATAQTVTVGNSISFTATVSPDNATDKTVKWSVSGTGVTLYSDSACSTAITTDTATSTLTVYAKGTAAGNATVTVTSNADSSKTASCAVTVEVEAITLRSALVNGATLEVKCKSSNDMEMGGKFTYNDGVFTRNNFVGSDRTMEVMKATATVSGTTITLNTGFTTNANYDHNVTFNTTDDTYTLTGGSLTGSVDSVKVNGTEILSQLTRQ